MVTFLWKVAYCVAAAGVLTAVSAGSFLIGYRGGYEQALRDEQQRFPSMLPVDSPAAEWHAFHEQRWLLPPAQANGVSRVSGHGTPGP